MTFAYCTFEFEAFHAWPDAPTHRHYLSYKHRHVFQVRAEVLVLHADRDIEFHDLLDETRGIVDDLCKRADPTARYAPNLGAMSCEMIAGEIASALRSRHTSRPVTVEVSEDGENGARVSFE